MVVNYATINFLLKIYKFFFEKKAKKSILKILLLSIRVIAHSEKNW